MLDYLASALENLVSAELGNRLRTEPSADPFSAAGLHIFDAETPVKIRWGRIVDAIPFANAYLVNLGPRGVFWCSDSSISGYQPYGSRSVNTIPIGSFAYVVFHPDQPYWGTIIAVDPPPQSTQQWTRSDYIWTGSRSGIRVDDCHSRFINTATLSGLIQNWNNGRPIDATTVGEWGAMTETGLGIFLDPFMAYLRVDEETGLFAFLHDALIRLAGHNLQIRSSVSEREDLDDEGEVSRLGGYFLYAWEALGRFLNTTTGTRTYTAAETQGTQAAFGTVEPLQDDQQPFHRLSQFHGYLGQGGRRSLCLPPDPAPAVSRYVDNSVFPGVFEESLGAAGGWAIRSAQHIILSKRPCIPVPKLIKRPEDPTGDAATNYNAAGGLNDQETHVVGDPTIVAVKIDGATFSALTSLAAAVSAAGSGTAAASAIDTAAATLSAYPELQDALYAIADRIERYPSDAVPHLAEFAAEVTRLRDANPTTGDGTTEPPANLVRAAAILDLGAFAFNWGALHPYHYHSADWYLPEEGSSLPVDKNLLLPSFDDLATQQYLPAPIPIRMLVDHRHGSARYFPNESIVTLLPDGGIVLGDGYGAEIRMSGGSIKISCPGELWFESGKDTVVWAGWDIIQRAFNSVDVTTSRKDIRLRAENNIMALAGNNGEGGVLIESKATCPAYDYTGKLGEDVITTGVVLKAKDAQVVCWGRDTILWGDPENDTGLGQVIIDAGSRVRVYTPYLDRFISGAAFDFFTTGGVVTAANEYSEDGTLIGADFRVLGRTVLGNCVWINGNVSVADGHIATEDASVFDYKVAPLSGTPLTTALTAIATVYDRVDDLVDTIGPDEQDSTWRAALQAAATQAAVSLRTQTQYKTSGFSLFESRWQQMARLGGATGLATWDETPVIVAAGTTYPHPGRENWTGEGGTVKVFYQQDLDLYDLSGGEGKSVPRGSNQESYEIPVYRRPTPVIMASSYQIITDS